MMMNFEINQAYIHNNDYIQLLFVGKRKDYKQAHKYKYTCCTFVCYTSCDFPMHITSKDINSFFLFCRSEGGYTG